MVQTACSAKWIIGWQNQKQAWVVNKTSNWIKQRHAEAPSLLLALSFLYGLIYSDSCSPAPPANASPETHTQAPWSQTCKFLFSSTTRCLDNDACWENKHTDRWNKHWLAEIMFILCVQVRISGSPMADLWGWKITNWLPSHQADWLAHPLIFSKVIWLTDQITGWQP